MTTRRALIGLTVAGGIGLSAKYLVPHLRADAIAAFALGDLLSSAELDRSQVGFCMNRLSSGELIGAHLPDRQFICGSNRKLFLTAAALLKFGINFRRTTFVRAYALPINGVIVGPLVLCGIGDPLLYENDLLSLARQLYDRGIRQVIGPIVGDGSLFTSDRSYGADRLPKDMPGSNVPGFYARQLVGQVAGLSVNRGVRSVYAAPGEVIGDRPFVSVDRGLGPFRLENRATTQETTSCQIFRKPGTNVLTVEGTVGMNDIGAGIAAVPSPSQDAALAFKKMLNIAGIAVTSAAVSGELNSNLNSFVLAAHSGLPLNEYIASLNKNSDALLAESLARALGQSRSGRGDITDGCQEEQDVLKRVGFDGNAMQFVDGSGMDPGTRTTPQEICHLLRFMVSHPNGAIRKAFVDSLAIAGRDGTLAERMVGTSADGRVRAKTGTLAGYHCVSGIIASESGRNYVFSLAINNASGTASQTRALIDRMIVQLVAC